MPTGRPFGITHRFQRLFQSKRYVGYVLLTLSPLYSSEDFRARLACLIHTASVRSEPGSNPSVELIWLCFFVESSPNSQPFPTPTRRPVPEVPTVTKRRHARTQIQESLCFQRTRTLRSERRHGRRGDLTRSRPLRVSSSWPFKVPGLRGSDAIDQGR